MTGPLSYVSPKQAALALGASESSLKRWVDRGDLAVERSAGGHRRIPVGEVLRFAHAQGIALREPAQLGLADVGDGDLDGAVHAALEQGDGLALRHRLLAAWTAGTRIAELGDGPLRGALARIGELWRHGDEGIAIEHRAVALGVQAVAALRSLLPVPAAAAPVAVGGAPAGDPYLLPSALAAAVLHEAGLVATDLGPDTPEGALAAVAGRLRPALVWRSCSAPGDAGQQVALLHAAAGRLAPALLVVGGSQLPALLAAGLLHGPANLRVVPTLAALADIAQSEVLCAAR